MCCPQTPLVDLHNHTTYSDGEWTPQELVRAAVRLGYRAVAITDHDTLDGLPEAVRAGQDLGIQVICGVEASVRFREPLFTGTLHVLLYFSSGLAEQHGFVRDVRQTLAQGRGPGLIADRLAAINHCFGPNSDRPLLPRALTDQDLYRHGQQISRRHFAKALGDLGVTDRAVVSQIIGNDSPAYVPSGVPLVALRDMVHRWPVLSVLAHPAAGSFPGESHYKEVLPPLEVVEQLLPLLCTLPLDGLEVCYPGHTAELQRRVELLRRQHQLPLATGGSDCHDSQTRPLGTAGVGPGVVELLEDLWREKGRFFDASKEKGVP